MALLISILLSSMVFLFAYNKSSQDAAYFRELAQDNLESGLALFFYGGEDLPEDFARSLYGSDIDSVSVRSEEWGLFGIAHARGVHGPARAGRSFLFGAEAAGPFSETLFLSDNNRPLSVSGNTRIEGKVRIPQAGIRRAIVGRENYKGEKTLYGEMEKSTGQSCRVSYAASQDAAHILQGISKGMLPPGRDASGLKEMRGAWTEPTVAFASGSAVDLYEVDLRGHILLAAPEIRVHPSAKLDHVLLFASRITFLDGFEGRVQAFATDSLVTGTDCHLHYPSVLLLAHPEGKGLLHLRPGTILEGMAINDPAFIGQPAVKAGGTRIDSAATVYGNVYAIFNLDLQGEVIGHTFTHNFRLQTPGSVYENHLLHARLGRTGLSETYAMGLVQERPGPYAAIESLSP